MAKEAYAPLEAKAAEDARSCQVSLCSGPDAETNVGRLRTLK